MLTADLPDTILLRALGIPAAPFTGISTLTAKNLQHFCEAVGIYFRDEESGRCNDREDLWTSPVATPLKFAFDLARGGLHCPAVSTAEVPPRGTTPQPLQLTIAMHSLVDDFSGPGTEAVAAVTRLCDLEECFELETQHIEIWTPVKDSIDRIRFLQQARSRPSYCAMRSSIHSTTTLGDSTPRNPRSNPHGVGVI